MRYRSLILAVAGAAMLMGLMTSDAEARGRHRRGGSSNMLYQAQLRAYQKMMADMARTAQEQGKAVDRVVMQTFDKNGNGKIDSSERGAAEGFMRHLRMDKSDKTNGGTLSALKTELAQIADRKGMPQSSSSSSAAKNPKKRKK